MVVRFVSKSPYEFIKKDIDTQRRVATELLSQIEEIEKLVGQQAIEKGVAESLKSRLIAAAKQLAENANETSSSATSTIVSSTAASS